MSNECLVEKGILFILVLWEPLKLKVTKLSCMDLHEKIKRDKVFFGKVLSSEKYNICQEEPIEKGVEYIESSTSSL